MSNILARIRTELTRDDVVQAVREYDRLGPDRFFSQHGYGPSLNYELVFEERRYPHKAILGTAFELATGERLAPADFEGGKDGAVAVLSKMGFVIEAKQGPAAGVPPAEVAISSGPPSK